MPDERFVVAKFHTVEVPRLETRIQLHESRTAEQLEERTPGAFRS
jgi:hypothetical protein